MKQIYILSVFILFGFYSCQSSREYFSGKYVGKDNPNIFEFFEDSTFEYKQTLIRGIDFVEKYSKGKWRISGNTIILNSNIQNNLASIELKVTPSNAKQTSFNVNLDVPGYSNKDFICYPILNDDIFSMVGPTERGSYSFYSEINIDSIRFEINKSPLTLRVLGARQPEYYKIYSETKALSSKLGDKIDINLAVSDSIFSYRIFTNTILKIKGNFLYFKDSEKGKEYKLKIKNTKIN